jgi:phosphoglycolate phosphatase
VTTTTRVRPYRAVLIDLDGTLVDTLPEMTAATNAMMVEAGKPMVAERVVAEAVGEGAGTLVARLIGHDTAEQWLPVYLAHYRKVNGTLATLYPNARQGLLALRDAGLMVACVTNKPREMIAPLFESLGITDLFDCTVGGGDTIEKKPHPEPLLFACAKLGVDAHDCVMIGDSKNDAIAANAAGIISLTVPYGYPGSNAEEDRAPGLLERRITCAIVADLLAAARWISDANRP